MDKIEKMFLDLNSVLVKFWKDQGRPEKEVKIALLERMLDWYKKMGYVTPQTLSEEPDKGLEEEISRTYHNGSVADTSDMDHVDYENIARHFAEWGAEHLRDSTKMIGKSLEEVAINYSNSWYCSALEGLNETGIGCTGIKDAFKAGAEWQASRMPMPEDTVLFQKGVAEGRRLEKQKEQKPAEWSEEDKAMIERLIRHTQKEFDELCNDRYGHQEIISDLKDSCRERMNWLENRLKSLRPQPKQEWSEEDEDVFNDILLDMVDRREMFKSKGETTFAENTQKKIDWLDSHHLQLKYSYCPQPEQEWSDRDKEMLEFVLGLLDNLVWRRDWEISKAECLEWLVKSLNPTKKEWSEDDEKMRINILNALTPQLVYSSGKGTYTGTSTYKYDDEIKWLKSLRPSWKLSEDEERLINTSISFLKDFADKGYENAVECIDWLKSKLNGNSCK